MYKQRKPSCNHYKWIFQCKAPLFWENDTENRKVLTVLILNNSEELINEPTHIQDGSQSYLDLITTDHPFIFLQIILIIYVPGSLNLHIPCSTMTNEKYGIIELWKLATNLLSFPPWINH